MRLSIIAGTWRIVYGGPGAGACSFYSQFDEIDKPKFIKDDRFCSDVAWIVTSTGPKIYWIHPELVSYIIIL